MRTLGVCWLATTLTGCGTTIYGVRVPLATESESIVADAPNIVIEDLRPQSELKVHTGARLLSCERWYGDDTYIPSKLVYLEHLLAQQVSEETTVRIRLERFDTIEYCENTANRGAAAAATGASGGAGTPMVFTSQDVPFGDSVLIRLKGRINDAPFDVSRRFDYSQLRFQFTEMPSANAQYRAHMREALKSLVAEIVAQLGNAGG